MDDDLDMQFYQLILSLQAGAMQQMGKIASPISGQIERNLNMARATIDILEMIDRKTKGNLNTDEKQLLDHILYELRLNFVDEQEKDRAGHKVAGPTNSVNSEGDSAENQKES